MQTIEYSDFLKIDVRVGRIVEVNEFPEARKPAYKLTIDFGGEIGNKRSSAQITEHYKVDELIGMKVMAVVNFKPKQIGPFISEVLVLGVPDNEGNVVLVSPTLEHAVIGGQLY